MNEKRYSIILADGMVLENLRLNGNNYISDTPIDATIFEGNCSPVIFDDGEEQDVHENMALIHVYKTGDEYWMAFRDVSEQELLAIQYAASVRYTQSQITDDNAINYPDLFPVWSSNSKRYNVDDRVKYGSTLYKCLQSHISQPSWTPTAAVSLWVRMDNPAIEWPEWIQPTGAHDAYAAGAKVSHSDKHWVSDVDANTWEPGVYGWTEQTE